MVSRELALIGESLRIGHLSMRLGHLAIFLFHCIALPIDVGVHDVPRPSILVSGKALRLGVGSPITWQGWTVIFVFLCLVMAGALLIHPRKSPTGFVAYVVLLNVLLVGVCWWKGEPPRWRWDDD